MYIPKISEIKEIINGLYEKFSINSQSEKANLIRDYIIRLETIFNDKNANFNYLYKFILIVIKSARSPLMTTVNIDLLKEKFEERHIRIDAKKILRNRNFDMKDIKMEISVKFDPVNYASESSEDEFLNENNFIKKNNIYNIIEKNFENLAFKNQSFIEENKDKIQSKNVKDTISVIKKIQEYKKNVDFFNGKYNIKLFNLIIRETKYNSFIKEFLTNDNLPLNEEDINVKKENKMIFHNLLKLEKQININYNISKDKLEKFTEQLYEFYLHKIKEENFQYKNSFAFSNILNENFKKKIVKKNTIFNINRNVDQNLNNIFYDEFFIETNNNNKTENFIFVDSNYLLISVLNHMILGKDKNNNDPKNSLQQKSFDEYFENFYCLDLDKNIQNQIIYDLNKFNEKVLYLKNIDKLIKENKLSSYVIYELVNFTQEISKCIEIIFNSYLKIAFWQNGKMKNPMEIFIFNGDFLFNQKSFNKYGDNKNQFKEKSSSEDLIDSNIFHVTNHHYFDSNNKCVNNEESDYINNNKKDLRFKIYNNKYKIFMKNLFEFLDQLKKENLSKTYKTNKQYFQRIVEEYHNINIIKYLDWNYSSLNQNFKVDENEFNPNKKLTLLNLRDDLVNFYQEKLDYLIFISDNMLNIKFELDKTNNFKPYLFIKEFFDFLYLTTKQTIMNQNKIIILLATELFFSVLFSYLDIIQVFILNGNLIDTFNEFFLDHIFTKKEDTKIVFNFNEKFKNFDWFNSFKIKSYSLFDIEGGCVPEIFKNEQVNFKILETGKSVFLIKNLRSLEKINFDIDIELETRKMKEIRTIIYEEIYKIINLDFIRDQNFKFYYYFISKKFREDNFYSDKIFFKSNTNEIEIKYNNQIRLKNDFDNIDDKLEMNIHNNEKTIKRTNNLLDLKKNIRINTEVEYKIFRDLPYNLNISEFEVSESSAIENRNLGLNFYDMVNIRDNYKKNEIYNFKNIFNEEKIYSYKEEISNFDKDSILNEKLLKIKDIDKTDIPSINNEIFNLDKFKIYMSEKIENEKINNNKINNFLDINKDEKKFNSYNRINKENKRNIDLTNLEEILILEKFAKESKDMDNNNDKYTNTENIFSIYIKDRNNFINFNLDHLLTNEIIQRIKSINKTMNEKLLAYLLNKEKIKDHFELCFAILFFRAGFSMNIFVNSLLEITEKGMISDNFFLKNLITEISINSDLKKFHIFIKNFFYLSINKDILNNFDTFKIEYKPNLPISIFFDGTVNTYYSAIFNYIFNIKRMNESFKLLM